MGLNVHQTNSGYRLGRLLAVLERLQSEAQGRPNQTIVDRYYGAASTRPATVFPMLLSLSMHHSAKLKSPGYFQKQLGEVLDGVASFPLTLALEDQGMFALGYFHQRQNYFKKANLSGAPETEDIQKEQ